MHCATSLNTSSMSAVNLDRKEIERQIAETNLTKKESSALGNAVDKLKYIANKDATPAEKRKMIELVSAEEAKRVVAFIHNSKQQRLQLTGADGKPMIYQKCQPHYKAHKNTSILTIERPDSPNMGLMVICVDNQTGVAIPHVGISLGRDTQPMFVTGLPIEKIRDRIMANCENLQVTPVDTKAFVSAELVKEGIKLLNVKAERNADYWDSWMSPNKEQSESHALFGYQCGRNMMESLNNMHAGFNYIFNTAIQHLLEVNLQQGTALGSLRCIPHRKIDPGENIRIQFETEPTNYPLTAAVTLLRCYAMTNKTKILPQALVWLPSIDSMLQNMPKAFSVEECFRRINGAVPLIQIEWDDDNTLRGRDYSFKFFTANDQKSERVSFMVLEFNHLAGVFETALSHMGSGMANNLLPPMRQLFSNLITTCLSNIGCLTTQPVVMDGQMNGALIALLENAVSAVPTVEVVGDTMAEKQQAIVDSWVEMATVREVCRVTLPIGVMEDENGDIVDARVIPEPPVNCANIRQIQFSTARLVHDAAIKEVFPDIDGDDEQAVANE